MVDEHVAEAPADRPKPLNGQASWSGWRRCSVKISDSHPRSRHSRCSSMMWPPTAPGSKVGTNWCTAATSAHHPGGRRRRSVGDSSPGRSPPRRAVPAATSPSRSEWSASTRYCRRHGGRVLRLEAETSRPHRLRHRRRPVGDDREAVVHRLQERDPEPLVLGDRDVDVGGPEVGAVHGVRNVPDEVDRPLDADGGGQLQQRVVVRPDEEPPTRRRRASGSNTCR